MEPLIAIGKFSYGIESTSMPAKLDCFERIEPGAFRDSIESGADIVAMLYHESLPIARTSEGTLRIIDGADALRFEIDLAGDEGEGVADRIEKYGMRYVSPAFYVNDAVRLTGDHGHAVRAIRRARLVELTLCKDPCYGRGTSIAVRGDRRGRHPTPGESGGYIMGAIGARGSIWRE